MTSQVHPPRPCDVLLVAEHGTRWARWMSGLADAGVSLAVIIQRSHESPSNFAQRVRERTAALALVKRLPPTVFFVASRRIDEHSERARATLARTLVQTLARAARPQGKLLLAADRSTTHETIVDMKRIAASEALHLGRTVRVASAHAERGSFLPTPPELPLPAA
ncbi:hypothetical protein LVJ94_52165 [Pendulispora rubella]|uniref:Uncharacterized protein n=1 Tax=Pendulispora rubella TaxID=2741070 RepID=A0ABZ2L518_9BACT